MGGTDETTAPNQRRHRSDGEQVSPDNMGRAGPSKALSEGARERATHLITKRKGSVVGQDGVSKVAAVIKCDDKTGRTWDSLSLKICVSQ